MGSYFGISQSGSTASDQLVESYIQTQQYRLTPLNTKKTALENKLSFFNTVNSKLNQLVSSLDKFGSFKTDNDTKAFQKLDKIDDKFVARKVNSSQDQFVTATADSKAMLGTNTVRVDKLATADTFIGTQLKLADKFSEDVGVGSQQFTITIGDKTKVFNIAVDEDSTNETIMKRLVQAVNASEDNGGFGGKINAAFVKDTSSTGRLTLTSKDTGEENKISFSATASIEETVTDDGGNTTTTTRTLETSSFAKKLGFDDVLLGSDGTRTVSTNTTAGFKTTNASELNSQMELNGVKIIRGSNVINDAIDGVTFTIKKAHTAEDPAALLSTEIDAKAVETLVEPLVTAFNSLANYLVTAKAKHGSDPSMLSLQGTLRNLASTKLIDTDDPDIPKYLSDIGYTMSNDNVLKLTDSEKLSKVLEKENGAQLVADLFTSANGFAAKVSEAIDSFVSKDDNKGLIKNRLESINQQITANNKRITDTNNNIEKMAEMTRKQYESYLSIYYTAQNQMLLLSSMGSSGGSAYDSLISQQYS